MVFFLMCYNHRASHHSFFLLPRHPLPLAPAALLAHFPLPVLGTGLVLHFGAFICFKSISRVQDGCRISTHLWPAFFHKTCCWVLNGLKLGLTTPFILLHSLPCNIASNSMLRSQLTASPLLLFRGSWRPGPSLALKLHVHQVLPR